MKYKALLLISIFLTGILLGMPGAGRATELPEKAYVEGITGHRQSFPLSCEARSAVDVANYWGVDVTEKKFLKHLPRSENPDKGFVGSPSGVWGNIPPASYGVHAAPIAETLVQFGLDARAHVGLSLDDVRREIAAGRPVIVWVIGQMDRGTPVQYRARDGSSVRVAYFEHTMILIGYDSNRVYVLDAYTGREQSYPLKTFTASWKVLDHMAVTITGRLAVDQEETLDPAVVEAAPAPAWSPRAPYVPPLPPASAPGQPAASGHKNRVFIAVLLQQGTVSQPRPTAVPLASEYRVKKGEYLIGIARELGVNWKDLARWNGLESPYTLHAGQVLLLKEP